MTFGERVVKHYTIQGEEEEEGGWGWHYLVLGGVKILHYVILNGCVLFGIVWFSLTSPRRLQM